MPSLTSLTRHGLAALAAAVLVGWAVPLPAAAEAASVARVDRAGTPGEDIHFGTGESAATTLFDLRVDDDATVRAYCVDVSESVDHQAAYAETGWTDRTAARDPGRVNWIVRNSYPALPLERVAADSGVPGLRAEQAIAGTQAAIWHFTNGVDLAAEGPGDRNSPQARTLYEHLLDGAADVAEPSPALAIGPAEVVGEASAALGPLTVRTTSEQPVRLTVNGVEGVALVDELGDPVSEARDGDQVLLSVPAGTGTGTATVYAHAEEAAVRTGRVYTGRDGVQTQPLVAAEPATASLTVSAKVNWNAPAASDTDAPPADGAPPAPPTAAEPPAGPAPDSPSPVPGPEPGPSSPVAIAEDKRAEPDLPFTGTWLGAILLAALVLLGLGAVALVASALPFRRRRE
ncbi:thioester domain-containing protein [Actinorugispora endophytica]|uniref:TQXA domain-containing protein n=1 Tax=Actinorugispora endophytica TaxID=1605990 RepID=A0A4R6V5G6_9ACTN|nr:thioester domain-containing protein [Actinorugispora endophytica]TDQ53628.1 TQXA domain-containing protein [Actinorugispora endophytica]